MPKFTYKVVMERSSVTPDELTRKINNVAKDGYRVISVISDDGWFTITMEKQES